MSAVTRVYTHETAIAESRIEQLTRRTLWKCMVRTSDSCPLLQRAWRVHESRGL